jgi:hypothetical protein
MSELPVDQLLTVDQALAILDAVPLNPRIVRLPRMFFATGITRRLIKR